MDGNGRWASQRGLPRIAGHKAGVDAVREIIQTSAELGIEVLSLFAFSSENWSRPPLEVKGLMTLFFTALNKEIKNLHKNGVRIRFIGERSRFSQKLQTSMTDAETLTADNTGLILVIAVNYGGRWDITQACRAVANDLKQGLIDEASIDETFFQSYLSLRDLPEPDLFIRTSGEQRMSNFFLWQCAYSELFFTDCFWPDFRREQYEQALEDYQTRQRRFGKTADQIDSSS